MNKDFCVLILTHGRPDNVITLDSLKASGYTGDIHFVVDNEDKSADQYIKNFGADKVHIFDKKAYADKADECNNFNERRTITYARNASFDIAKKIGVKYFMQLDDDYTSFLYRNEVEGVSVKSLDKVLEYFIEFYQSIPALSIAFSQGGDHIGGFQSLRLKRKCMNSFLCDVDKPFKFVGAMNEDVNTYTTLGSRGELFFTYMGLQLNQKATQSQAGGITDMYLRYGTYAKAFTTVMNMPSSVKVSLMGRKNMRLHHHITWRNTVPRIISEEHKKQ
jgi:hypothetical protein